VEARIRADVIPPAERPVSMEGKAQFLGFSAMYLCENVKDQQESVVLRGQGHRVLFHIEELEATDAVEQMAEEMADEHQIPTSYIGLEAFPIQPSLFQDLNEELQIYHLTQWGQPHQLSDYFNFEKIEIEVESFETEQTFHLIYFDAFAPEAQPELWTTGIFEKLRKLLVKDGVLTTYCSKVLVQKNLKQAGYKIEKHQGPPHKREILRAINLG
jgi:tRNA U34 5-methylaminomethyl-2-thiouridine-forming methyltransferase MnmC